MRDSTHASLRHSLCALMCERSGMAHMHSMSACAVCRSGDACLLCACMANPRMHACMCVAVRTWALARVNVCACLQTRAVDAAWMCDDGLDPRRLFAGKLRTTPPLSSTARSHCECSHGTEQSNLRVGRAQGRGEGGVCEASTYVDDSVQARRQTVGVIPVGGFRQLRSGRRWAFGGPDGHGGVGAPSEIRTTTSYSLNYNYNNNKKKKNLKPFTSVFLSYLRTSARLDSPARARARDGGNEISALPDAVPRPMAAARACSLAAAASLAGMEI